MEVYIADVNILEVGHNSLFHNLERTSSGKLNFCNKHLDTQHGLRFFSNYCCSIISLVDILMINYTNRFYLSHGDCFYGIFEFKCQQLW